MGNKRYRNDFTSAALCVFNSCLLEIEVFGSILQNYCLCDPINKYVIVYTKKKSKGMKNFKY